MPKRLAEIVIDANLASREEVLRAAHIADEQRMPLVAVLVHRTGIDELAIVAAIRRQVRVSLLDPAAVKYDPEALREMPQETCRRLRLMPLSVAVYGDGSRVLRLAMADPTDAMAIAEVEHQTGCQVENVLVSLSAVEEMVTKGYRSFVTAVMRRDRAEVGDCAAPGPVPVPSGAAGDTGPVEATPVQGDTTQPATVPFHRLVDEATLEVRHRALLNLLIDKRLVSEEEYNEHIRALIRQRDSEP